MLQGMVDVKYEVEDEDDEEEEEQVEYNYKSSYYNYGNDDFIDDSDLQVRPELIHVSKHDYSFCL